MACIANDRPAGCLSLLYSRSTARTAGKARMAMIHPAGVGGACPRRPATGARNKKTARATISPATAHSSRRFVNHPCCQGGVVALRQAAVTENATGRELGNLGFSRMILGIIARDGDYRPLACESWQAALTAFERAKAMNQIIGFHEGFMPGLRRQIANCASGAPIVGPLRE